MIPTALLAPLLVTLTANPPIAQDSPKAPEFRCIGAISLDRHVEDRWYHTRGSEGVSTSSTDEVVRKQYFALYPFFTNPSTGEDGRARVQFEVRMLKPDGTVYFEEPDFGTYEARIDEPRAVFLSRSILHACFEPEDANGTYTVQVVARDVLSGASSKAEHQITLVDYVEGDAFTSDEELNSWVDGYFRAPDPLRAIPALRAFAEHGLESEKPRDARGFLREIFEGNHWLFSELIAQDAKLTTRQRDALMWLLARSTYDATAYTSDLDAENAETWSAIRSAARDPLEEPIAGRTDVNELWNMYLASRRYAVCERLCLALDGATTGVVADVKLETQGGEVPLSAVTTLVVGDLLGRMARIDGTTRNYLEWMVMQDSVPESVRDAIDDLLAGESEDEGEEEKR